MRQPRKGIRLLASLVRDYPIARKESAHQPAGKRRCTCGFLGVSTRGLSVHLSAANRRR